MKDKRASNGKNIVSFIVGALLMFSIMISMISLFIKFIVLNPNTYLKILDNREIHRQIYEFLDGNIEYALTVNNISAEVKDNIISSEEVKKEVDNLVKETIMYFNTGENNIKNIDIQPYSDRVNSNLKAFLKDNAIHIDNNVNEQITNLESDINSIIKNELEIINLDVINNYEIVSKIAKLTSLFSSKLYLIPVFLSIVILLLFLIIWGRDYIRLSQWIGNSFIAAGLFVVIIFFSGYVSKFYNNIIIDTVYLRDFMASVLKSFLGTLSIWGVVFTIIGVVLLVPKIKMSLE